MPEARLRPTHYCPSCGERVFTYSAQGAEQAEIRCGYCGLPLELTGPAGSAPAGCVVVVDDDKFFRALLVDLLIQQGLATEVLSCDSGPAFLAQVTQRFRQEQPVRLAILDILMAPLDGVDAALALRAIERGFDRPQRIPVVFFSAARATEVLRQQMVRCAPAYYLNKASDSSPERLTERMRHLFDRAFGGGAGALPRPPRPRAPA